MADNFILPARPTGDPGGPTIRAVDDGTALHQALRVSGVVPGSQVAGNITAAQPNPGTPVAGGTVGGTADVSHLGNVAVVVSGTHAGVNLTFEASNNGGTTWYTILGQKEDTGLGEGVTGVLPSNATRAWSFPLGAANRFRVRAGAFVSGSMAVTIDASPTLVDPVVAAVYSPPVGRVQRVVLLENEPGIAADTLIATLQTTTSPGTAITTAQSSIPVTAGRTFRITSLEFQLLVGTATTPGAVRMRLRFNASGAAVGTSPLVASWYLPIGPASTIVVGQGQWFPISLPPEGLELPASAAANGGFAFSKSSTLGTTPANSQVSMMLLGYEY